MDERQLHILVVEDHADSAESLRILLEHGGDRVIVSDDAASALRVLREEPFDVVLSDVGLPGMDGYELARRVRNDGPNRDISLIAMSGYGRTADKQLASESGFTHHLTKPIEFAALEALLKPLRTRTPR